MVAATAASSRVTSQAMVSPSVSVTSIRAISAPRSQRSSVIVFVTSAAVVVVVVLLAAFSAQRSADRADISEVMRLDG